MKEKDMHLPVWACAIGIFFIGVGVFFAVECFINSYARYLLGTAFGFGVGISAILCWKNQWVIVLNEEEFVYSTMFGKKTKYKFSQITGIRYNRGSTTLFLGDKKVHIESGVIISSRFKKYVSQSLKRTNKNFNNYII